MTSPLKSALFLATFALPLAGRSQQPFPTYADNGTWNVLQCLLGPPSACFTQTFTYDGSETFCGHTWSVYSWPTWGMDPGIAYFRNEGQRTLLRQTTDCEDKEYLVYDFSMEVGDTVYAAMNMELLGDDDTSLFVLQSIDTVEQFGIERRRFHLLYDRCGIEVANTPMDWIEGVGSTMHPFFPLDCVCDFCEQGFMLLCYDSAGVQLYVDPMYNTCDTLITGIGREEDTAANVQIIYDPLADVISVRDLEDLAAENSSLVLILMAGDGRVVKQQGLTKPSSGSVGMDVAAIAPGAYAVLLTDGQRRIAGQRIVIQ